MTEEQLQAAEVERRQASTGPRFTIEATSIGTVKFDGWTGAAWLLVQDQHGIYWCRVGDATPLSE